MAEETETPDVAERGAGGASLDRRLYAQLLVFRGAGEIAPLCAALESVGVEGVLYADAHVPDGVGVLAMSEDPAFFVGPLREALAAPPFSGLTLDPSRTILGRSYAVGYERDLEETLLARPRRHALDPERPWAIWYPLRRSAGFERLPAEEKRAILGEHGTIGRSFAEAGLAVDVRLACHGLDRDDNDFAIGLMGRALHPLSALVQRMRATRQTAEHLSRLGPFFVGHVRWRSGSADG